jgi:hypothetical protein
MLLLIMPLLALRVKGADDFGATISNKGGFINMEEVWARGVPSRVKAHLIAMKRLEFLHFSI